MDFLEGYLLGPQWSDTEYETRHHVGFHVLVGFAAAAAFGFLFLNPDHAARWIWPWHVPVLLLFALLLANPLLCRHYYRYNRLVRVLILAVVTVKYALAILALFAFAMPLVRIDTSYLASNLLAQANESIAAMTDRFHALNNASAMMLGIILGSLLVLLRSFLVIAVCVLVPTLSLLAIRWIQRILDFVIRKQLKFKPDME
ncbi:MAG: hypothetical protein EOM08_04450 [Clostridia bacterium]|nr:hypothetical protein [Clostridia bacterium]NCC75669.1 hypothetical protein [Clostridia bacterium]